MWMARRTSEKTAKRGENERFIKYMMKTSTIIYHIAERDIKEDDSIYELNLPA